MNKSAVWWYIWVQSPEVSGLALSFISEVQVRVRIVARFAYAMKENIKKNNNNFVVHTFKVKQVGNVIAPWLPGKSSLDKVL